MVIGWTEMVAGKGKYFLPLFCMGGAKRCQLGHADAQRLGSLVGLFFACEMFLRF